MPKITFVQPWINTFRLLTGLYLLIFLYRSCISFKYLIKALESLKRFKFIFLHLLINNWYIAWYGSFAYRYVLSVTEWWWYIRLTHAFAFLTKSPQLIIFCMNGLKYNTSLDCPLLYFLLYNYESKSHLIFNFFILTQLKIILCILFQHFFHTDMVLLH